MDFWNWMGGVLRVRIISADVEGLLTQITSAGLTLEHTVLQDMLTADLTIKRRDKLLLERIGHKAGAQITVLEEKGLYWRIKSLFNRPLFLLGFAVYMLLAMVLPTRIFFVQVEGNRAVSEQMLLTAAENAGIQFGASRNAVRSERVKNALLAAIPELNWAGVNTYGSVAVISVKERTPEQRVENDSGITSVIAKCDGVIQALTVTRGNILCKVGQAVKAGQILVSGYTDCGITIQATSAEAEVFALTNHNLQAIMPTERAIRQDLLQKQSRYSLIIGKKRIKLYKGSGISGGGCVKIYETRCLTLPGGFQLPVSLVEETTLSYRHKNGGSDVESGETELVRQAQKYLEQTMVSGQVLSANTEAAADEKAIYLSGTYACREIIGQIYYEEILTENERNG